MTSMTQPTISRFFQGKKPACDIKKKEEPLHSTKDETTSISQFAFNNQSNQKPTPAPAQLPIKKRESDVHIKEPSLKRLKMKLTPMENQIITLLTENSDKVLLVQYGNKYVAYGEKGEIVSKILNMKFVEDKNDLRFDHCSFPDHKLHIHLQRILNHGYKVGIVKQIESSAVRQVDSSKKSSDILKREVTAVYTKATYFGDEDVQGKGNADDALDGGEYLVCVNEILPKELALVAVRPSTGEIIYDQFENDAFNQELDTRLRYLPPTEVVVIANSDRVQILKTLKLMNNNLNAVHCPLPESTFESWKEILGEDAVELYSINYSVALQNCVLTLLEYLKDMNLSNIFSITDNIIPFQDSKKYMVLQSDTLKALEVFTNSTDNSRSGSLVDLMNHTKTSFGSRLFHKWISRPLIQIDDIQDRTNAIIQLSQHNIMFECIENFLLKLKSFDMETMLMKLHYSANGTLPNRINRKEVYNLLNHFNDVFKLVSKFEKTIKSTNFTSSVLENVFQDILSNQNVLGSFLGKINPNFYDSVDKDEQVKTFFYRENFTSIEAQFQKIADCETMLTEELELIRNQLNNKNLQYVSCKNETYLIAIRHTNAASLSEDFIRINTTKTIGRYRTKRINELRKLMSYEEEMLLQCCEEEFKNFVLELDSQYPSLIKIVKNLAIYDCLTSLRDASKRPGYVQPRIVPDLQIKVRNARHPIIEQLRPNYISSNINLEYNSDRVLIITGPNMGGKSSYVKTVALFTIMSQVGCFLPCDSATMGVFDSIFIRMGASDDILKGQSTFMLEMLECKNVLLSLSDRSLVILDEIGRGTSTTDGIALAYSILKYLIECEFKPLLLFITHYPSIHVLEKEHPGEVSNYHMGYEEIHNDKGEDLPEIVFLYKLRRGVTNSLYGLNVARLAGIPKKLISSASIISEEMKSQIELSDCLKLAQMIKKFLKNELDIETLLKYLS